MLRYSRLPLSRVCPSGENEIDLTGPSKPLITWRSFPDSASHSSIRPKRCEGSAAPLAIANVFPSGEKEIANTTSSKPVGASNGFRLCAAIQMVEPNARQTNAGAMRWHEGSLKKWRIILKGGNIRAISSKRGDKRT